MKSLLEETSTINIVRENGDRVLIDMQPALCD
jgi:hypothetical protein